MCLLIPFPMFPRVAVWQLTQRSVEHSEENFTHLSCADSQPLDHGRENCHASVLSVPHYCKSCEVASDLGGTGSEQGLIHGHILCLFPVHQTGPTKAFSSWEGLSSLASASGHFFYLREEIQIPYNIFVCIIFQDLVAKPPRDKIHTQ